MRFAGLEFEVKNRPKLDGGYIPLAAFIKEHQRQARQPFAVAVERENGLISVYETRVCAQPDRQEADLYYLQRLVKFLLYSRGGFRVLLCGDETLGQRVAEMFAPGGPRQFDRDFMQRVYGQPFETAVLPYSARPAPREGGAALGRHLGGCRIGFDAGGSDRKVSAVVDGESVYSEEVVWHPKENSDPDYHFAGIVQAFRTAASKMPRVDAIGVSSAGVYIDNRCKVASLFIKVGEKDFREKVEDIYLRAAKELGEVPVVVANDGDVTALAGAMDLDDGGVLGIAMGTSEAAGYVDVKGSITGWLNELAFAPVDASPEAMQDEWSGDIGCGVKYFSQDGAVKLAGYAGLALQGATQAERLKELQERVQNGEETALDIFRSLGVCLGHTLGLYHMFYEIRHVLLMGRVTSGRGGDLLLEEAKRVLREEYPECRFVPGIPDEKSRRVGQSVAAASLPEL